MSTNNQDSNTSPEPYRQTVSFNIEIKTSSKFELNVATKRTIEVKF